MDNFIGERYIGENITGKKCCILCLNKVNGKAFLHATTSIGNQINYRLMCIDCQLEIIFVAYGHKYLKKKVSNNIQSRLVAETI